EKTKKKREDDGREVVPITYSELLFCERHWESQDYKNAIWFWLNFKKCNPPWDDHPEVWTAYDVHRREKFKRLVGEVKDAVGEYELDQKVDRKAGKLLKPDPEAQQAVAALKELTNAGWEGVSLAKYDELKHAVKWLLGASKVRP